VSAWRAPYFDDDVRVQVIVLNSFRDLLAAGPQSHAKRIAAQSSLETGKAPADRRDDFFDIVHPKEQWRSVACELPYAVGVRKNAANSITGRQRKQSKKANHIRRSFERLVPARRG
jgi:hypothetical protein